MTITELAAAFAAGTPGKCHNACVRVDRDGGVQYLLHGHVIASRCPLGTTTFYWCGWYTPTTANHLRHLSKATGIAFPASYAHARDNRTDCIGPFMPAAASAA